MPYNPEVHHRRSIRLKGYDYACAGAYFVTVCAQHRECLFGEVASGEMQLNDAGRMVAAVWDDLSRMYAGVATDAFIVMPNHIHGIIVLHGDNDRMVPSRLSLPDVVHRFKSLTTTRYREGVTTVGWTPFPGRLWQRNYYEHIIRNEIALVVRQPSNEG